MNHRGGGHSISLLLLSTAMACCTQALLVGNTCSQCILTMHTVHALNAYCGKVASTKMGC